MKPRKPIQRKTPIRRTPIKPRANATNSIKKVADKRKTDDVKYSNMVPKVLAEEPICRMQFEGCTQTSTQVHHIKGRGIYYLVRRYMMGCCASCHKKEVENDKLAKDKGVTVRRNDSDYLLDLQKFKTGQDI